jgi:small-conductance mechanosensitive channel/CRP-like cAMP-binding protein
MNPLVRFIDALLIEAVQAWTPWLVALVAVSWAVARVAAVDHPRFKAVTFFAAVHLAGVLSTAALRALGSPQADAFRTPAWVLGSVAFVGSAAILVFSVLLPRLRLSTPPILQDVLVGVISVVVAVMVASRANVNLSGLIATSAVLTAVLGFSLQDVIGNIAGGLALQMDGALETGDWVKVGDVTGRVVEVRWRHTAIETRNWETVLIPNAVLMKSQVTILARRQGQASLLRRWVCFNVDWRHQPSDVIAVVEAAVRSAELPRVAKDPAPNCVLMDMSDTFGKYAVRYWLRDLAADDGTDSDVRTCVYFALQRAEMPQAIPAHALFLTEESADRQATKTKRQLQRRLQLLGKIDLFAVLSEEERIELSAHLKYSPFTRGDVMTKQGAPAHWLYLVEEGQAVVRVSEGGLDRDVATIQGPTLFGEMSLLTGAPRSATVIATSDVECFRLEKVAVQRLLEARPALAQQLAELLARRQVELDAAREGLDAQAARAREASEAKNLLGRIRQFFALG